MRYAACLVLGLAGLLSGGCWSSNLEPADAAFAKRHLGYLPGEYHQVRHLSLQDSDVTDADMATVARFNDLQDLNLSGTAITDAGLAQLPYSKPNKVMLLTGTAVTSVGVMRFVESHPSLELIALEDTTVDAATIEKIKARGIALCVRRTGADGNSYMLIQD